MHTRTIRHVAKAYWQSLGSNGTAGLRVCLIATIAVNGPAVFDRQATQAGFPARKLATWTRSPAGPPISMQVDAR